TNFFMAAGYVAGGDPARLLLAQAGNYYHELDPVERTFGGSSYADFSVSMMGIQTGNTMSKLRQSPLGPYADQLLPAIAYGAVSQPGHAPLRLSGMTDAQYQKAIHVADAMRQYRDGLANQYLTLEAAVLPVLFNLSPIFP
ncbi:MAG: hypothetical protein HYV63_06610, partial [Candidatus Schekmanbacteria bacterium]|nr:hypothetical protein [Candidatus Schekmanbacteria bacterium]